MNTQEDALKAGEGPGEARWGVDDPSLHGELTSADGGRRRREVRRRAPGDAFCPEMAEHIASGAAAPVNPRDARDNIAVIEAALHSAEEGRTVRIGEAGRQPRQPLIRRPLRRAGFQPAMPAFL